MAKKQIEPIKDVQFTFVNFLWKELGIIREMERNGEFEDALVYAITLVDYMPFDFQETLEFQKKGDKALKDLNEVKADNAFAHRSYDVTRRCRNLVAQKMLRNFLSELALKLDSKGYMEKKGPNVERGFETL